MKNAFSLIILAFFSITTLKAQVSLQPKPATHKAMATEKTKLATAKKTNNVSEGATSVALSQKKSKVVPQQAAIQQQTDGVKRETVTVW